MKPSVDRTLTATETLTLGDVSDGTVSRWVVQVVDAGSMNVSIAVKGAVAGAESALTATDLEYRNINTGTDVSGVTAITAVGKFMIEATGLTVQLVVTVSGGSVRIVATPRRG